MTRAKATGPYTAIIVHQFDPENPAPGGIDTCIRDMLLHAPAGERILLLGVSQTRPLLRRTPVEGFGVPVDFVPLARVDPGNQRRRIPHSIRLLLPILLVMLRTSTRRSSIHTHRLEASLVTRLFPARRHVYFVHTNTESAIAAHGDSFWKKAPGVYRFLEKRVLAAADLTLVFNRASAELYQSLGYPAQRVRTWFNESLYYPRAADDQSADSPTAVWVGRFESPKDPVLAVDVFSELARRASEEGPEWKAIMVGDGTLRPDVDARIEELGLKDHIRLVGAQPRSEVGTLMRNADVLLMTSHFEGSPIVMYEGLASGIPVVATSEADPDQVLTDDIGRIIQGRNPADIAKAAEAVLSCDRTTIARAVEDRSSGRALDHLWKTVNGDD